MDHSTLQRLTTLIRTNPSLPARHWPNLNQMASWSNQLAPTCIWSNSDQHDLPQGWVSATAIPNNRSNSPCPCSSRWTTPELISLAPLRHVALLDAHYSPTFPDTADIQGMIYGLVTEAYKLLTSRTDRHHASFRTATPDKHQAKRTRQPDTNDMTARTTRTATPILSGTLLPPTVTECSHISPQRPRQPKHSPPALTRVHFPPADSAEPGALTLESCAPPPPPLVHPALRVFEPPAEPTARHSTRAFPRAAHLSGGYAALPPLQPPPPDDPFYTLCTQPRDHDLILIGAATAPGSRYGAYARTDIDNDG